MDLVSVAYLVVLAGYLLWAVRGHAAGRGSGWILRSALTWVLIFVGLAIAAQWLGLALP